MAAEITINQPLGAGAGTPGEARNDLWEGQPVELVASSGVGTTWLWEFLDKPPSSSATISDETTALATYTPDVVGTYRVRLVEDNTNISVKVLRVRYDSSGVLKDRGWCLPALNEGEDEGVDEANYGSNTRGWDEPWQVIKDDLLRIGDIVYDLFKGVATDATGAPTAIGAEYVDSDKWPAGRTITFRCILESTSVAQPTGSAHADLYDTGGSLGAPAVVSGSPVDTTGVGTQIVPNMVEVDVTAAFASFTGAGVFEVRLWINTAGGGNVVTCKSAQLIVEW